MTIPGGLPFDIVRHMVNCAWVERARFRCSSCETHTEVPVVRTKGSFNPEAIIKRAESEGWSVRGQRLACPRCQTVRKLQAAGEKPGPKEVSLSDKIRELTQAERLKIRAILDKHFDDGVGSWLDGYSDQKAGEELNLPWAWITKIREAAYGPIRVDPEVATLQTALAQFGKDLKALADREAILAKRLDDLAAKRRAA